MSGDSAAEAPCRPSGSDAPVVDRARAVLVAPHLAPLVVAVGASAVVGRPEAWLGALLPLGPLAVAAGQRLAGSGPAPGWRPAALFATSAGTVLASGWALVNAARLWAPFGVLFPVGLLLVLLGVVNVVAVSASRSIRAWRGQPLDYPWIPARWSGSLQSTDRVEGG